MQLKRIILLSVFILIQFALFVLGINFIGSSAKQTRAVYNELLAWQQKDQDIRVLQNTYYQNKSAIDLINQSLPTKANIIPFFEKLEGIASQSNVQLTIDMTAPPQEEPNKNLLTVLLRLKLRGRFAQINQFIKDMENQGQLVIVRQAVLTSPNGLADEVNATVMIKTFFTK